LPGEKARFRSLFHNSPTPLWRKNPSRTIGDTQIPATLLT